MEDSHILVVHEQFATFENSYLKKSAIAFCGNDEALLLYIFSIIEDESFQKDPISYIKSWDERRGMTLEFRYPEDEARIFFHQYFGYSSRGY